MNRESALVQSFVELADTLVEDFDVIDLLTRLADRCVSVLGFSAAGVMLASPDGRLRLVASSSETMRVLEMFELQTQEGPCLDAFRTGEPVEEADLRSSQDRWPRFSVVALEAGFGSVFALPMRLRTMTVGALNIFSSRPEPVGQDDLLIARAFADLATISLLQSRTASEIQIVNEQLTQALADRVTIEQAKGVIFERARVDMAEAFSLLLRYARANDLLLADVAQAVIDGSVGSETWIPSPPPPPG